MKNNFIYKYCQLMNTAFQKLELCALRRDNAVDRAKALVPTQYQVRAQAIDEIQKVQDRINNLYRVTKS